MRLSCFLILVLAVCANANYARKSNRVNLLSQAVSARMLANQNPSLMTMDFNNQQGFKPIPRSIPTVMNLTTAQQSQPQNFDVRGLDNTNSFIARQGSQQQPIAMNQMGGQLGQTGPMGQMNQMGQNGQMGQVGMNQQMPTAMNMMGQQNNQQMNQMPMNQMGQNTQQQMNQIPMNQMNQMGGQQQIPSGMNQMGGQQQQMPMNTMGQQQQMPIQQQMQQNQMPPRNQFMNNSMLVQQQQTLARSPVDLCGTNQAGDIIPNPTNTNQFVICYGFGEFTIMDCPEHLVYNPHLVRCDLDATIPPGCSSNPCMNNGKCIDLPQLFTFRCECPAGFTGQTCDKLDSCSSKPCGPDGVCISMAVGSPMPNVCMCNAGRTVGSSCNQQSVEMNPCFQPNSNLKQFPTRINPSVFIHCEGTRPHFVFCQFPLVYSPMRQVCDWTAQ